MGKVFNICPSYTTKTNMILSTVFQLVVYLGYGELGTNTSFLPGHDRELVVT
uniref:Uncharacterized protein n=1 Tax=Picea sitchensis TaxID=3332 RepID=A0A6B9XSJ8_PICSI|nr:hypothetical protein Q903MT_gene4010 [Picea sitchensis]